jgi:ribosomal protein S18 acetylase RimI-like enzyme
MTIVELPLDQLDRIAEIDRAETCTALYRVENGELVREDVHIEIPTWNAATLERAEELLRWKLDGGGSLLGVEDDGGRLVAVAALSGRFLGERSHQLELAFLYVSNGHRRRGLARALMDECARRARGRGAEQLYVSASETDSAIGFYLAYGCRLADEVDPQLYELEPTDVHLVCDL